MTTQVLSCSTNSLLTVSNGKKHQHPLTLCEKHWPHRLPRNCLGSSLMPCIQAHPSSLQWNMELCFTLSNPKRFSNTSESWPGSLQVCHEKRLNFKVILAALNSRSRYIFSRPKLYHFQFVYVLHRGGTQNWMVYSRYRWTKKLYRLSKTSFFI